MEWIDVKERLPIPFRHGDIENENDECQLVLMLCDETPVLGFLFDSATNEWCVQGVDDIVRGKLFFTELSLPIPPTHWMEIPEQP